MKVLDFVLVVKGNIIEAKSVSLTCIVLHIPQKRIINMFLLCKEKKM